MYIDNFSWIQRIKVALEFAKLLEFLHDGIDLEQWPYLVFNLDSTNITLDQAYNPILIVFRLLSGGIIGGPRFSQEFGHMPLGYCELYYANIGILSYPHLSKRVDLKEDVVKFDQV
ncbi:hypothetical protein LguiB_013721 [Lonicera macranthoides]